MAAAAPAKVFGVEGLLPELALLPDGEANNVQSPASAVPLLTVNVTGELVAAIPAASVAFAVMLCAPSESVPVLSGKVQLLVPLAGEKLPLSTDTWTDVAAAVAVPLTLIGPLTVAPAAGEVIIGDDVPELVGAPGGFGPEGDVLLFAATEPAQPV